ncbi:hypothetical protein [Peribacillus butanolivorans]
MIGYHRAVVLQLLLIVSVRVKSEEKTINGKSFKLVMRVPDVKV